RRDPPARAVARRLNRANLPIAFRELALRAVHRHEVEMRPAIRFARHGERLAIREPLEPRIAATATGRRAAEPGVVVIVLELLDALSRLGIDEENPTVLVIHRQEFGDETRALPIPLV